ncbi:hypothetical protein BJY01DRAFT_218276 [Aspergillus pseudoustus]|uniref:Uncharacterized protein n=1 Tax=Aspergillus pseudoustus TaxID=1810923 RepID=A0ABR4JKX2_9EURO
MRTSSSGDPQGSDGAASIVLFPNCDRFYFFFYLIFFSSPPRPRISKFDQSILSWSTGVEMLLKEQDSDFVRMTRGGARCWGILGISEKGDY